MYEQRIKLPPQTPSLLKATLLLIIALIVTLQAPAAALTPAERRAAARRGIVFIDDPCVPAPGGPNNGGAPYKGHVLPASYGGTGVEDPIDEEGRIINNDGTKGSHVAFADTLRKIPLADRQPYQDFYITMRWRYVYWNWDGGAPKDGPEDTAFYRTAPKVVVTNPANGKSILAVVLESGPAPWTGILAPPAEIMELVRSGEDPQALTRWVNERKPTDPLVWKDPYNGTPPNYNGRVSGLPPKAIEALGAKMKMPGSPAIDPEHDLTYTWADESEQNAVPGPLPADTSGDTSPTTTSCEAQDAGEAGANCKTLDSSSKTEYFCSSKDIPCAAGKDEGVMKGYSSGKPFDVRICLVRGIRVNSVISGQVDRMIGAAKSDGITLEAPGGGFRTMERQIEMRSQPSRLCGDNKLPITRDEIYNAPSKSCSPPTARPGYSNHQMGLAIDFEGIGQYEFSDPKYKWLKAHAADYGLQVYSEEAWHWSVNGG